MPSSTVFAAPITVSNDLRQRSCKMSSFFKSSNKTGHRAQIARATRHDACVNRLEHDPLTTQHKKKTEKKNLITLNVI